ncbi:MAG: aromatic ring-hydroxylating dioxygenase subunit alpha [Azospirillaceae bacterium]
MSRADEAGEAGSGRRKTERVAAPYSGYHAATVERRDDAELTRVGPGTPCGEYLRRYWHPIALVGEIGERPLAIRVLGEDLVLFRDLAGRLGLLHRHCLHRGASLEFGIPSDQGIRCCYHGWKFDIDGTILETPAEPPSSKIRTAFCQGAYPVREFAGLVFAYLGPPEAMPPMPVLDSFVYPAGNELVPYKLEQPSNWLQAHENGADAIHSAFLHADLGQSFTPVFGALPVIDFFETPLGVLAIAVRRWGPNLYVRASDVFLPNFAQFGSGYIDGTYEKLAFSAWTTRWIVPIDDTHCWTIGLRHINEVMDPRGESDRSAIGLGKVDLPGQTGDRPYAERQREPGDYDAQVSQGAITSHASEHLGTTDRGIAMLRRRLRAQIRAVGRGEAPDCPDFSAGETTPTYIHEIVVTVPPPEDGDDIAQRRDFGRRIAAIVIESGSEPPDRRRAVVEERLRALKVGEPAS